MSSSIRSAAARILDYVRTLPTTHWFDTHDLARACGVTSLEASSALSKWNGHYVLRDDTVHPYKYSRLAGAPEPPVSVARPRQAKPVIPAYLKRPEPVKPDPYADLFEPAPPLNPGVLQRLEALERAAAPAKSLADYTMGELIAEMARRTP